MVAEWVKRIAFQVSFAFDIDETAEFADIVLPDTHSLERSDLFFGPQAHATGVGIGHWCYQMRHPVVEPPPNARNWLEVLFEIADRVGFRRDLYYFINVMHSLKEPYTLDLDKKYSWEEIHDIWAKSWFGPEHDFEWFKKYSFVKWPRKIEEVYPRVFIKGRLPIYIEHLIQVGEDLKRVTDEMGIPWDVSDYQPLVDWKPSAAYEEKRPEFDLFVVNYKTAFHTWTHTTDNIWLNEIGEHHPSAYYISINNETARRKGLKDGDEIWIEEMTGERVKGRIKLMEGIHPEVIGIAGCFGHWARSLTIAKGKGIHYEALFPARIEDYLKRIDWVTCGIDWVLKVKIYKVE